MERKEDTPKIIGANMEQDTGSKTIKKNPAFQIEELDLTPEEHAEKAVSTVLRDKTVNLNATFIALAENRINLQIHIQKKWK